MGRIETSLDLNKDRPFALSPSLSPSKFRIRSITLLLKFSGTEKESGSCSLLKLSVSVRSNRSMERISGSSAIMCSARLSCSSFNSPSRKSRNSSSLFKLFVLIVTPYFPIVILVLFELCAPLPLKHLWSRPFSQTSLCSSFHLYTSLKKAESNHQTALTVTSLKAYPIH